MKNVHTVSVKFAEEQFPTVFHVYGWSLIEEVGMLQLEKDDGFVVFLNVMAIDWWEVPNLAEEDQSEENQSNENQSGLN